ncbi:MAG: phenylalanine--tRNA ligase subunit alpha [Candidatus Micrarchaeia archaeon]|jgi:phenylalanyl-tRNA synthetase alpha chain
MNENELRVLKALGKNFADCRAIASESGIAYDGLMSSLNSLESNGWTQTRKTGRELASLSEEGKKYLSGGTPERRLANAIEKAGKMDLPEAVSKSGLAPFEAPIALQWASKYGWVKIEKSPSGKTILVYRKILEKSRVERALEAIDAAEVPVGVVHADGLKELLSRRLAKTREEKIVEAKISEAGLRALSEGKGDTGAIAQLTPEMLSTGGWKGKGFRKYEANAPSPTAYVAKKNPLRDFADEVRGIFLEMGFREIKGPIVESSFWNFDALFVPQDHPSRELQDTFFVRVPPLAAKPDEKFAKGIKAAHENGGNTGSRGWGYQWSEDVARQTVLRTHTTEATCRSLADAAAAGKFPVKVFCIDRVFRNEAIDFKHLAEFHQVEGIVIDDSATLNDLVGVLKTFFAKLGFPKVRVRPGFFPYTEPSAEIDIWFEERKEWLELGGAGVFRPEVTRPLGITQNVLAWGLSLERPLMLREKLSDIRTFYRNDLDWIRKEK